PGLSRENIRGGLREHNSRDGLGAIVRTAFNVDEQAHLYISVIDTSDSALLLTQHSRRGGSAVGKPLTGPQTKFIQYAVLIPPPPPRIPATLVPAGPAYQTRISAPDPSGNKSSLLIPLTG